MGDNESDSKCCYGRGCGSVLFYTSSGTYIGYYFSFRSEVVVVDISKYSLTSMMTSKPISDIVTYHSSGHLSMRLRSIYDLPMCVTRINETVL